MMDGMPGTSGSTDLPIAHAFDAKKAKDPSNVRYLAGRLWPFFSPIAIAGTMIGLMIALSAIIFKIIGKVKTCSKVVCSSNVYQSTETYHSIYIEFEDPWAYFMIGWYGFYVWAGKTLFASAMRLYKLKKLNYIVFVGTLLSVYPSIYNCFIISHYINVRATFYVPTQVYFCLTTWIPMIALYYLLSKDFYPRERDKNNDSYKIRVVPDDGKLVLLLVALSVLLSHIVSGLIDQNFEDLFLNAGKTASTFIVRDALFIVADVAAVITIGLQMRTFRWKRLVPLAVLTLVWVGIYELIKHCFGFH